MFGSGLRRWSCGHFPAADYVKAYPSQLAVLLSVELCSSHCSARIIRREPDLRELVRRWCRRCDCGGVDCDLPDLSRADLNRWAKNIGNTLSVYPETEKMMGWAISEKGFRIVLSREVPNLIRQRSAEI